MRMCQDVELGSTVQCASRSSPRPARPTPQLHTHLLPANTTGMAFSLRRTDICAVDMGSV